MSAPLVVSFGGGVNSAAMLVGMRERGIQPDLILFADTGGEKPETYAAVQQWSEWCFTEGFPEIITVANDGVYRTLENNCLTKRMLPSLAYGFKSCSQKYKIRPNDKYVATWQPAIEYWQSGGQVIKAIGFDAGEPHRVRDFDDRKYHFWSPLIDWGWDRNNCIAAIERAGMPIPHKSSCFFCPASKKSEVLWLKRNHPLLYHRAVLMERNAELTTVKGLGRHWSWEELGNADDAQFKMFPETVDMPCICFDGKDTDEVQS